MIWSRSKGPGARLGSRPGARRARPGDVFRDEQGFTTTSMVLSLLITLALVFTAAQVYRVNSASAAVQDVADACALAAENQVAEFMLIARFCDAVVLSLSLTGLAAMGLGLAALCTPPTAPLSEGLIDAGRRILETRSSFSNKATDVLNKYQKALPFFAAAAAAGVASANDEGSAGSRYLGAAVLVPAQADEMKIDVDDGSDELIEDIDERSDEIRENAKRAEEAAQEANRSKERAFMRDCGDNPSYCMYERAASLAGLGGSENPLYTSVDAWSFGVALQRARHYYAMRLYYEGPEDYSVEEQQRSSLRERFYRYAVDELSSGYVYEDEKTFDAYFPHLPSNTREMRFTSLYTDGDYPITEDEEGVLTMHGWTGCPVVAELPVIGYGSIAYMEEAGLPTCPVCGFTAASLGRVAAASSSIENGFEYHYEAVADEAFLYEKARDEAAKPTEDVKSEVGSLLEQLIEAAKAAADKRVDPSPPGKFGAVAFVVNAGSTPAAGGFANGFVSAGGALGPRAAVSASTLVDEGTSEGKSAVNSALDGLRENGGAVIGAAGIVLDAWSWMLVAYGEGQDALVGGIEQGLNALPLVGASGLGTWASEKLTDAIDAVGLQPAEVGALKPALVNSGHVAARGEGGFASGYLSVKKTVVAHPLASTDLFSALLADAEREAASRIEGLGDSIEVASIELTDAGPSIPITIPLPPEVKQRAIGSLSELFGRLESYHVETSGVRVWE